MTYQNSKIALIIVLYKTSRKELNRLRGEIKDIGLNNYKIYFIDNTKNDRGFASGVNEGVKKALLDDCQLLIVCNPDISLKGVTSKAFLEGGKHFDMWGLAMRMHGRTYYGGVVDPLRLSGGLLTQKPQTRFKKVSWISGSLMCIKKKVIQKTGFFDESYFMYYEDVDYCHRAQKAGFRVGIDSEVVYEHFENSSSNAQKDQLLTSAKTVFFKKYSTLWQKIYEYMRFPKTILEKRPFFVNFMTLNLSSFASKLLNFILFIALIRYLDPKEYGIYTLVWAQIMLFSPLVDLGTTSYGIVHLSKEKRNSFDSLFNLRIFSAIIVFFLTLGAGILMFRADSRIIFYIFLTSFVIFSNVFSGSYLIQNAIQAVSYRSSILSIAFNIMLVASLILGVVVGKNLTIIFFLIFIFYSLYAIGNAYLLKKNDLLFSFKFEWKKWRQILKKSYMFVLISFFAGLYFKIDVFLIQFLKGAQDVGVYTAGYKFFEALIFIAGSYNIAATPLFAKLAKKDPVLLLQRMKRDSIFLLLLGGTIVMGFVLFGPWILARIMKTDYTLSIQVLRIVIFALPLILLSSVFLNALYVVGKSYIVVVIFLLQTLVNIFLNLIYIPKYSFWASAYITVLSELLNVFLLMSVFKFVFKKTNNENIG